MINNVADLSFKLVCFVFLNVVLVSITNIVAELSFLLNFQGVVVGFVDFYITSNERVCNIST